MTHRVVPAISGLNAIQMDTRLAAERRSRGLRRRKSFREVGKRFVAFGEPSLGRDEIREVIDTIKSGWIGTGPKSKLFEQRFAQYVGTRHALAVNSCTAGLHLGLLALDVGPGDEVITTPLTFAATLNVILHVGATPVLADINNETLNIDPGEIEAEITERTKAIIPVHFGGLSCDMKRMIQIAKKYGLAILEDAAHAVGARYNGRMVGSFNTIASFSFYANKNITTAEGGMVTTNDRAIAGKIEILRLHGLSADAWKRYGTRNLIPSEVIWPGYKYNLTDLQASLGIHQLAKLEKFLTIRERYAKRYDLAFNNFDGLRLQYRPTNTNQDRHALHLYVLILDPRKFRVTRDQIVQALRTEGIGAAIHYKAIHRHYYYRKHLMYKKGSYPIAESVGDNILSLPLSPRMTSEEVGRVIHSTLRVLRHHRR